MAIRLRQLGREMKDLRKQAGLTQEQAAARMECSKGRLIYLEQGKGTRPSLEFVRALLDLYGVTDTAVREALVDLARQGKQKGWWTSYGDLFPAELPGWEDEATTLRMYDTVIPGLLQTADYAAAMFRGDKLHESDDVERKVKARLARQTILRRDDPPHVWAVIDEVALRRKVGGAAVMADQLRHLVEFATWPHITIQVLPFGAGAHAALDGAFVLLDFGDTDQPPLVFTSDALGSAFRDGAEAVGGYGLVFNEAVTASLTPDESASFMASLQREVEDGSKQH